jgi:hypothetical protein
VGVALFLETSQVDPGTEPRNASFLIISFRAQELGQEPQTQKLIISFLPPCAFAKLIIRNGQGPETNY